MRRRRNAAPADISLSEVPDRAAPPFPAILGEVPDVVLAWWEAAWTSPMAAHWHPGGDLAPLTRLAETYARLLTSERTHGRGVLLKAALAIEDRFGLSPLSRARLRWVLPARPIEIAVVHDLDDLRARLHREDDA